MAAELANRRVSAPRLSLWEPMADGGAEARAPNDPSAAIEAYVLLRGDGDAPLDRYQGETPNSFSMSAIIGCVRPALRNSAKFSTMAGSHSLPF